MFPRSVNIPPPILEKFYNQGGDGDANDHEHEDEQDPYTQWRLETYSDGSPLLVCIQGTADVTRKQVLSHMVALSGPIPTSVAGYSGWILVY